MLRLADVLLGPAFARAPVFTTGEAAALAGVSMSVAARALGALAARGLVTRVVRGIWARPSHPDFSPYAVAPFLLGASRSTPGEPGYVSLLSALNLHGIIDQIPRTVQIVVAGQRPVLRTAVGTFAFHRLQPDLVTGYALGGQLANFDLATPTKAIFDTLYISTRRGRRFAYLPEVELLRGVSGSEMRHYIALIRSAQVRTAVIVRWHDLQARAASERHAMAG